MNTKLKWLLASSVTALLLAGCCTSRHAIEWEYKVVADNANANAVSSVETQAALLNDQAKQGWIFVQTEGGWFYFKRVKQ
jgi:hypothetical protein